MSSNSNKTLKNLEGKWFKPIFGQLIYKGENTKIYISDPFLIKRLIRTNPYRGDEFLVKTLNPNYPEVIIVLDMMLLEPYEPTELEKLLYS